MQMKDSRLLAIFPGFLAILLLSQVTCFAAPVSLCRDQDPGCPDYMRLGDPCRSTWAYLFCPKSCNRCTAGAPSVEKDWIEPISKPPTPADITGFGDLETLSKLMAPPSPWHLPLPAPPLPGPPLPGPPAEEQAGRGTSHPVSLKWGVHFVQTGPKATEDQPRELLTKICSAANSSWQVCTQEQVAARMFNGMSHCQRGWIHDTGGSLSSAATVVPVANSDQCEGEKSTNINLKPWKSSPPWSEIKGVYCCEVPRKNPTQCDAYAGEIPLIISFGVLRMILLKFAEHNVRYVAFAGTLLGVIRERSITAQCSEGDDDVPDIDLLVPPEGMQQLQPGGALTEQLKQLGFSVEYKAEQVDTRDGRPALENVLTPMSIWINKDDSPTPSSIGYSFQRDQYCSYKGCATWNNFIQIDIVPLSTNTSDPDNFYLHTGGHGDAPHLYKRFCKSFLNDTYMEKIEADYWQLEIQVPKDNTRLLEGLFGNWTNKAKDKSSGFSAINRSPTEC